jgi:hypothetical protein
MGGSSGKDLLFKALTILAEKYDPDNDCFFVVVTKDGKDPALGVTNQAIIGEMNVKTLIPFITQAIYQVCGAIEMPPHEFVARYITGALLDDEAAFLTDRIDEDYDDYFDEDDEEDDDEEVSDLMMFASKLGDSLN